MIVESLQEEACLYVLGLLAEREKDAFEGEMMQSAELRSFVAAANNATLALARSARTQILPPEGKQRLLAALRSSSDTASVVGFPKQFWFPLLPWAIAACLTAIVAWQASSHQAAASVSQAMQNAAEQQIADESKSLADQLGAAQAESAGLLAQLDSFKKAICWPRRRLRSWAPYQKSSHRQWR